MTVSGRLGRYEVGERIGEGGTGEVFRARMAGADGLDLPVAIKRLRPVLANDPALRDALIAEARLTRRLQHGGIAQVFDLGIDDAGVPYLVFEYIAGVPLDELSRARGGQRVLELADILYVFEQLAAALDYAHRWSDEGGGAAGVVHRDVKPSNVLVSREGVVKLTDFGIARAVGAPGTTIPGAVKGTLGYLAPEQARGEPVDARADQFAAGVVLYELLSGSNPLGQVRTLAAQMEMLATGLPPLEAPGVDADLAAVVARMTAVDRAKRYPSMREAHHATEKWRARRRIQTSPAGIASAVRVRLGEPNTDAPRAIDGAAPAETPAPAAAASSQVREKPRRGAIVAVVVGLVAIAVVAVLLATRG